MKILFAKIIIIAILGIFLFFSLFSHCYTIKDESIFHQVVSLRPLTNTQVIEAAGITVRSEDSIISKEHEFLKGNEFQIQRSKPVSVEIDGKNQTVYTIAKTVSDLLKEKDIELKEKDFINVKLTDNIENVGTIIIKTYLEKERVVKKAISYKTVYETNAMAAKGLIYKKQNGENGVLEKHYKDIYYGGEKSAEEFMYDKVVKAPINEIYITGNATPPKKYVKSYTVTSTAYSPTVAETDSNPWVTASGMKSAFGVIAVDPKVIPLGTLVYVDGYGYAIAGDTGGFIKGEKIDVFFYSTKDANKWGVKKVKIYILDGKWTFPEKLDF